MCFHHKQTEVFLFKEKKVGPDCSFIFQDLYFRRRHRLVLRGALISITS